MRHLLIGFLFLVTTIAGSGCSKQEQSRSQPQENAANQEVTPTPAHAQQTASEPAASATAAGIQWQVPKGWQVQPPRSMRVATYSIPAAAGDEEGAECAVFFFGSGQGGDVRSNIDRWISQFQTDSKPQEASKTVNRIHVTTVTVSGTYLAPAGPMMQSTGQKSNYRLLGAIVEAPEGAVFFKATGPAATIAASEKDFTELLNSIHKTPL